jgi:hypothetical protein
VTLNDAGEALAAQHARDFVNSGITLQEGDLHAGAVLDHILGYAVVLLTVDRRLRQMGDRDNLVVLGDPAQLLSDSPSDLATDIGVNLVEDEDRDAVVGSQHRLDREHDARNLTTGGDCLERAHRFAWIRGKAKGDVIGAMRRRGNR